MNISPVTSKYRNRPGVLLICPGASGDQDLNTNSGARQWTWERKNSLESRLKISPKTRAPEELWVPCHQSSRMYEQSWQQCFPKDSGKEVFRKSVLPATINFSPYSPHSHTLTLGVISLRVWEVHFGRIHFIKSVLACYFWWEF